MSDQRKREQSTTNLPTSAMPADEAEPIRSSFSLSRYGREAIRRAASPDWYGTTQGEVVSLAPALYSIAGDLSLESRRKQLGPIRTLAEQAQRAIRSMAALAPHLGPAISYAEDAIEEILTLEQTAIRNRDIHGVKKTHESVCLVNRGWTLIAQEGQYGLHDYGSIPDPFIRTLQDLQKAAKSDVVIGQGAEGEVTFQCCEGEREKELRQRVGDYFAEAVMDGRLSIEQAEKAARAMEDGIKPPKGFTLKNQQDNGVSDDER